MNNQSKPRAKARSSWWPLVWLQLSAALVAAQNPAHTNLTSAVPVSNRYLLIVETSRSMKARGNGALNAIQDLLSTGMRGQLRKGDTLGVWTFNKELEAGLFPLQRWAPESAKAIATRVLHFLQDQKCENPPKLDQVLPLMDRVVRDSDYITVILVTSGEDKIHGTPFDEQVNNLYKSWRKQQQAAHMPILTVLRAEKGKYADYKVCQSPWSPELPALPPVLLLARTTVITPAIRPTKPSPPPSLPPLIVIGKKPQAVTTAEAVPERPVGATNLQSSVQTENNSGAGSPPRLSALSDASGPSTQVSTTAQVGAPVARTGQAFAASSPDPGNARPATNIAAAAAQNFQASVGAADNDLPRVDASTAVAKNPKQSASIIPQRGSTMSSSLENGGLVPARDFWRVNLFWLAALACGMMAAGFVWFWRSRSRPVEHASLITRSFDHHA